jgi:hypothetical protein
MYIASMSGRRSAVTRSSTNRSSSPEYHERFYATFFLDMHGFMLEAVTYEKVAPTNP